MARSRTREGMAIAKAKGRLRGRSPKLSKAQETHLVGLYRAGRHTTAELAELFGVSRATVYRAVGRAGPPPGEPPPGGSPVPPPEPAATSKPATSTRRRTR